MTRKRSYVGGGPPSDNDNPRVAFAKRLYKAMVAKGWKQSELARAATQHLPPGVEVGRHLISSWLASRNMPSPLYLEATAKALGMKPEELLPLEMVNVTGVTNRSMQMALTPTGSARLKIDMDVPPDLALKIMGMLNALKAD